MPAARKYTDEQLIEAVSNSISIAQILTKIGLAPRGGNYRSIKNAIIRLGIDDSHLTGQAWNKGIVFGYKRRIEDYLSNNRPISSYDLKRRLLSEGYFDRKCYKCNNTLWNDQDIPLELEHIDGHHENNSLDNLTLLCPNCHAQTDTYRGKNKRKGNSSISNQSSSP